MNTNEKFIELSEISKILKAKNIGTAQKWCEKLKLPILAIGRKKMSYRFLVEAEMDKRIIQIFKKKDPDNWEELYRLYRENDHYGYSIVTQGKTRKKVKASLNTKPLCKEAIEFLNDE
ncbi:hypothetical protein [Aquimarina latercula]|uniref:hypothetical protein n=1 Tax=Aquimarina latercula TaxID=987 RepID=UPI0004868E58|nr:hypothetical protein [Aquimarina latercula]